MLAYFPKLYESELLYSGIARYAVHTGTLESKSIIDDIFADKSVAAVVDFPSHIKTLCKRIDHLGFLKPKQVLQDHTLLPAFTLFLPSERATSVINSCYSNYGGNIHTRIGIAAAVVKVPQWLHICPKCMIEQRGSHGEAYLQREFQLPGVLVCSKHGELLRNTNLLYHPMGKHDYIAIEKATVRDPIVKGVNSNLMEKLIHLSINLTDLCKVPLNTKIELQQWTHFYHTIAVDAGALKGKNVDHSVLQSLFNSYWSTDILQTLSPNLISFSEWLEPIFRKHRKSTHPLKHALLWQVFAQKEDVKSIVKMVKKHSCFSEQLNSSEFQSHKADEKEINKRRSTWQKLIASNPQKGIKALRLLPLGGATYTWLYRFDHAWLELNKPKAIVKPMVNNRVDWSIRDDVALAVLHQLKSRSEKQLSSPRRTKAWYLKNSPLKSTLDKKLEKLPKCKQFLDDEVETLEQYQKRRIFRVAKELVADNKPLQAWLIMRKAGLRRNNVSPEIIQWIKNINKVIDNDIRS